MNPSVQSHVELIERSGLFDRQWYATEYPDVALLGADPIVHFLQIGALLRRQPSSAFNTAYYLSANPDVENAGVNPLVHYLTHGRKEGRNATPPPAPAISEPSAQICKRLVNRRRATWDSAREGAFFAYLEASKERLNVDQSEALVSVIMPTLNRADTISFAIESVLRQTHQNFELLVIDDGGEDNTEEVVHGFKDPRVRYIRKVRGGVSSARNVGLRNASGDYLFFLDSDNRWRSRHIEFLVLYITIEHLDAAYSGVAITENFRDTKGYLGTDYDLSTLLVENYIDMNAFCVKATSTNIEFDESIRRLVDWDYILGVAVSGRVKYAPFLGLDYYDGGTGNRITRSEYRDPGQLAQLFLHIQRKARSRLEPILAALRNVSVVNNDFRICVVMHVFHREVLPSLREALLNIPCAFDLFVTTSLEEEDDHFKEMYKRWPTMTLMRYPNIGRDVGPFIDILPTLLKYDAICKIHTKRDVGTWGGLWRQVLMNSLVGSKELVSHILSLFRSNTNLIAVGSKDFYKTGAAYSQGCMEQLAELSSNLGLSNLDSGNWGFFAGSMFWVRPRALASVVGYSDVARYKGGHTDDDGHFEHAVERALGLLLSQEQDATIGLVAADQKNSRALDVVPATTGHTHERVTQTLARLRDSSTSINANFGHTFFDPGIRTTEPQKASIYKNIQSGHDIGPRDIDDTLGAIDGKANHSPIRQMYSRASDPARLTSNVAAVSGDVPNERTAPSDVDWHAERREQKIAYVVWDWPALSQTFVMNELRWLVHAGYDIKVYFKVVAENTATLDFEIISRRVESADALADLLAKDGRTVVHSPFAYPATTLLTWPACTKKNIPFTFMPGGVDISHYDNIKRNRIAEVSSSDLCIGVITLGSYHRDFLIEEGVPSNKILMERQAAGLPSFSPRYNTSPRPRIIGIGRFIEKKGFSYLIRAAAVLKDVDFVIFGYGPLDHELRTLANELDAANVTFGGSLESEDQLHAAYRSADLFVLPCVRAENGDLDGLPTVILEAMASGTPVVSTRIANIPDLIIDNISGFLCAPEDPVDLERTIRRALGLSVSRRRHLIDVAKKCSTEYAGVDQTMNTLLQAWSRRQIDIILVTYDTPEYSDVDDTEEIIRRIYRYTVMPFDLYVVDNGSQNSFKERIRSKFGELHNFHFIELPENRWCGPASNIGIASGTSDYVIYVCSKEGFVLQSGWERTFIDAMDRSPEAAMGGYLVQLPKFGTGGAMQEYPSFASWRNQDFARSNPSRPFAHVQGGLYVLRRSAFAELGGFSDAVPQNGTDVEYSYYLESCGKELISIPGIAAISAKTLPGIMPRLTERTVAIHPASLKSIKSIEAIVLKGARHCVACGAIGPRSQMSELSDQSYCSSCGSSAFSRSAFIALTHAGVLQTRPEVMMMMRDDGLDRALNVVCNKRHFRKALTASDVVKTLQERSSILRSCGLVVIDHYEYAPDEWRQVRDLLGEFISGGGCLVIGGGQVGDFASMKAEVELIASDPIHVVQYVNDAQGVDPMPIIVSGSAQKGCNMDMVAAAGN